MPIYEYECPKCKRHMELRQKMNAATPPMCFEDGCDIEMIRVISRTSFTLNGTGWARDGYTTTKGNS